MTFTYTKLQHMTLSLKRTVDDDTFERLWKSIRDGNNVILTGSGGCGKTHELRRIAGMLVDAGEVVAMTAFTGVAATNLSVPEKNIKPRTLNSWAGIGLGTDSDERLATKVSHDTKASRRWMSTTVLIIDEISMLGSKLFTTLDYIGRRVRRRNTPFGGLQIICSGDFLQLPPVKDEWVFKAEGWDDLALDPHSFKVPKRYDDQGWFEALLRFRKATHTKADMAILWERKKAYEELNLSLTDVRPTVLYSRRVDVASMNHREMAELPGVEVVFEAFDVFTAHKRGVKIDKYLQALDDSIDKTLSFKVGAQVMLRQNLDVEEGLVNGSRGVAIAVTTAAVTVRFVSGKVIELSRSPFESKDDEGEAIRHQIPLMLAWSITIHKVQGLTLDYVVCDLGTSVFMPAQAYVALSRVRNRKGLFVSALYPKCITADPEAVAYDEELCEIERLTIEEGN